MNENDLERIKYVKFYAKKVRQTNFDIKIRNSHTKFINSQIEIANEFYKNILLKEKNIEKFMKLTNFSYNQTIRMMKKLK